jgi:anaerobic selenocysteine-containing dehydrogenase
VIKVEGDPESLISHGTMCSKGLSITQLAYHPDRILYPMKKIDGAWQQITWDEALDTIAGKFKEIIDEYGPFPFFPCGLNRKTKTVHLERS